MRICTRSAAAVATALVIGCGPSNDTEEIVRTALAQANLREVSVAAEGDAVRLSGTVDTLAERTRAVELAAAIVGTTRRVDNDITVTGLGPLGGDASRDEERP